MESSRRATYEHAAKRDRTKVATVEALPSSREAEARAREAEEFADATNHRTPAPNDLETTSQANGTRVSRRKRKTTSGTTHRVEKNRQLG
jgi:hypothetical protein